MYFTSLGTLKYFDKLQNGPYPLRFHGINETKFSNTRICTLPQFRRSFERFYYLFSLITVIRVMSDNLLCAISCLRNRVLRSTGVIESVAVGECKAKKKKKNKNRQNVFWLYYTAQFFLVKEGRCVTRTQI